jgi:protein associated with RNAse G/E
VRWVDGRITLEDEDEFDEHREAFGYPDDVAAKVRATATELLDAVRANKEPFATAASSWLAMATRLETS